MKHLFLFFGILFLSYNAQAQFLPLKKGQWFLDNRLTYFKTVGNFEATQGSFVKLDNEHSFSYTQFDVLGRFDFSKKLALITKLDIVNAASSDEKFNRDNSGLSDIHVGVISHFKLIGLDFFPEGLITVPMSTTDPNAEKPLLSDGVIKLKAGLKAFYFTKYVSPFFNLAFEYKEEGLASLLHFDTGAEATFGDFYLSGAVEYFTPLIDDQYIDSPSERLDLINRVNGGSQTFYSINPSLLNLSGGLRYRFTKSMSLGFKYKTSINGENAALSDTYMLNFQWRNILSMEQVKRKVKKVKRKKMVKEFDEELEQLKQNIENPDDI